MAFTLIRVKAVLANDEIATFGLRFETPVSLTSAELIAMADAAQTELVTHTAIYASDIELGVCTAQAYERLAGPPPRFSPLTQELQSSVGTAVGTAAGNSLPPQNAFVVQLRSASPGKQGNGRAYTFPPPEGVVDSAGIVSDVAARVAMVEQICQAVEGSIVPVDVDHVIHSLVSGNQAEVVTYTARSRIDTQRRRLARE